jgi:NhaP-type Na+/H+ or K+/H+ antiporter
LIAASLLSSLAQRSVLSTAVIFLAVGFVAGPGLGGLIPFDADSRAVSIFAELALFAILYTEGMQLDVEALRRYWRLPLRAIVRGMPLTILVIGIQAMRQANAPLIVFQHRRNATAQAAIEINARSSRPNRSLARKLNSMCIFVPSPK